MSNLVFPAWGAMCLSQQFLEGRFVFWGVIFFFFSIYFLILMYQVLWTSVQVLYFAQPMVKGSCFFDFWRSKENIPFGRSNFSHLYISSQLCWKFHFDNFDFGTLDWSSLDSASLFAMNVSAVSSLCCCPKNAESLLFFYISLHWHTLREGLSVKHVAVHVHNLPPYSVHPNQYPGTSEIWAFYIRHILWILVPSLLFIFRNLNQSIVSKTFCTRRKYISLFLFLCKMGLTGLHDSPACV